MSKDAFVNKSLAALVKNPIQNNHGSALSTTNGRKMDEKLEGKLALITGASGGIGRASPYLGPINL